MTAVARVDSSIEGIGETIIARLNACIPHVRADHFPDAPDRSPLLAAPESLLVHWKGDTSSAPLSLNPLHTDDTIEWYVVVSCRSLRGPRGIAQRCLEVRSALVGWRPPQGGSVFVPKATEFVDESNGVWRYRVRIAHTLPRVARGKELTGAPLGSVTLEGTGS